MLHFFKKRRIYPKLDWMTVDVHNHILPGLDDGVAKVSESVQTLLRLEMLGLTQFYFTPHVFSEIHPNSSYTILPAYEQVKQSDAAHLAKGYAAEYMVDAAFHSYLDTGPKDMLTLPGNYVLIEMSYMQESPYIESSIFNLQIQGYKPIIAHPERYIFYHRNIERVQRFREQGCLLQINLLSLCGYYGSTGKRISRYLADRGLVDLVGTDLHHERHLKAIERFILCEDTWALLKNSEIKNQDLFGYTA